MSETIETSASGLPPEPQEIKAEERANVDILGEIFPPIPLEPAQVENPQPAPNIVEGHAEVRATIDDLFKYQWIDGHGPIA